MEFINQALLTAGKAHGQEYNLSRNYPLGARYRYLGALAVDNLHGVLANTQAGYMAILTQKFLGHYAELPGILFKLDNGLLLAIVRSENLGEFRPGILLRSRMGQAGIVLQLLHAATALTNNRSHAVIARIATADDNYILVLGIHKQAVLVITIQIALGYIM